MDDTPVLCEMHDVMAQQYAFRRKMDVDQAELAQEHELLSRCTGILCISSDERRSLEANLEGARLVDLVPPFAEPPVSHADLAGVTSARDVLSACGHFETSAS